MPDLDAAKSTLLSELREHSLVIGEVTLSSGAVAQYYVDARRALLRPAGFHAAGELIAAAAAEAGADAVGGPATAAIPLACAAIAVEEGAGLVGFFVRGERKEHGLQRWVEGPVGPGTRCLVVEDTVTSGGSTVDAIGRIREEGLEVAGVLAAVDRLAGGAAAIEAAADAPVPGAGHDRRALPGPTRPGLRAMMEPDAVEIRVVGCLIEKQRTTPDVYPLSINALRLACNQSTNRDPVVDYDEETVVEALRHLALRGWTRLASGSGSRARKYRHLLDEALGVDGAQISLLAVLMLRGPQTPGQLKQRTERLHSFADLALVHETLDGLVERGLVSRHERRPGQKEDRYEQLLGSAEATAPTESPTPSAAPAPEEDNGSAPTDRLERIERELAELREQLETLRSELGGG